MNHDLERVLAKHAKWIRIEGGGERANLQGANLQGANLEGANLWGSNLWGANLEGANLWGANLEDANLEVANLWGANLEGANLWGANLEDANLEGANLRGANLDGAKLPHYQIPQTGALEVWKKLRGGVVCKLLIPADARRTASLVSRKCRSERAIVLEGEGFSLHRKDFRYEAGQTVVPDEYDPDIRVECSSGIHFFMTRAEAEEWL